MDLLERVLGPARDLLARVDATLVGAGAPGEHEVWQLLRRLGALPSDALEYVAALHPEPLENAAVELRTRSDRYAGCRNGLDSAVTTTTWEGAAGGAFETRWNGLGGYLGNGESADEASMAGRLVAMRSYLDDTGKWIADSRRRLAITLGEVLGSAEAVELRAGAASGGSTGDPGTAGAATAAAAIGARVLRTVDAVVADGHDLTVRWSPRLAELVFRAPEIEYTAGGQTRVQL